MRFFPHYAFDKIEDIRPDILKKLGIAGVILDIDNTLTYDCDPVLYEEAESWLEAIRAAGISAAILSNNSPERVAPFAERCKLPFISGAKKPSLARLREALALTGTEPDNTAVIGDQLFTDMWFARRAGCMALLVRPMGGDVLPGVRIKRILEKPFMPFVNRRSYKDGR